MCLNIDFRESHIRTKAGYYNAKQATRAIKVYKVLTHDNHGPYRSLYVEGNKEPWTKGYVYEEPKFPKKTKWTTCEQNGFHSCRTLEKAENIKRYNYGSKIVEMYIPKGAWYFVGQSREYFSSHLKWI